MKQKVKPLKSSYIKTGEPYIYVNGESDDYIFLCDGLTKKYIEDYGKISKETLFDLIFVVNWEVGEGKILKEYLLKKLAEKLKIKLRKKPLSQKTWAVKYKELLEKNWKQITKSK